MYVLFMFIYVKTINVFVSCFMYEKLKTEVIKKTLK